MVISNGEDSLNEKTEDFDKGESDLDELRERLGRIKTPVFPNGEPTFSGPTSSEAGDDEPTDEQLRATGELTDDEPGAEQEMPADAGVKPDKALLVKDKEWSKLSIREQVKRALDNGVSEEELVAAGYHKRSIQTIASELRSAKRNQANLGISRAPARTQSGMPIFAKGTPPEAIIDAIRIPDVTDGQGVSFEQGMKFGLSVAVLGIRMAQELSGIGITQAKPILEMAKSMREGEAIASKSAANQAAAEAAGQVQDALMPYLANLQNQREPAVGGNPMQNMMAKIMQPVMQQLMTSAMGRLAPGSTPPGIPSPGQTTPDDGTESPEGWSRRTE